MQYLGGKTKICKQIAEIINNEIYGRQSEDCETNCRNTERRNAGGECFVSLFCGSCAIESLINAKTKILNDKHKYLIEMFKGLQCGYELPDTITEQEYKYVRENKDKDPCLTGFVGFACSFGGKWFGGYARCHKEQRNYCLDGKNSLLKAIDGLRTAKFLSLDYKDVPIPEGAVVYCDPPYECTTGYTTSNGFDYDKFWEYMRELSKTHKVFISEQKAPKDFECIWSKAVKRTLDANKENQPRRTEKLFVYNTNFNIRGE